MKTFLRKMLLVIMLTVIPSAIRAYDAYIDGIYYDLDTTNKTASVTRKDYNGPSYRGTIIIPEEIRYNSVTYSVTSIDDAFYDCTGLTSITIPNSVTSIGNYAFERCTGLTSINIPNSVTNIGNSAFEGCTGLTSINIPDAVTSIGDNAFYGCTGLTSITIPNSVTSIGNYAFERCTGLTSINIPNSVTSIGNSAFEDCTGLTSITIPNSVTSIGYSAFRGCTGLTSITIPDAVTSIGDYAFDGCTGLTSITIPDAVTSIGNSAFYGCTGLTSINIPNSVTSIGNSAFRGCTGLTSITIPDAVTSIGGYAFYGCTEIKTLEFNAENCIKYGEKDGTFFRRAFPETISTVKIGNNVTIIPDYFLYGNENIIDLDIPNSVTSIGNSAFYRCSKLTTINIPNSVTSIGNSAFESCWQLKTIIVPSSVKTIGTGAFEYTGLRKIVLYARLENYNIFSSSTSYDDLYIYESEKEKVKGYWKGKIFLLDDPYIITPYQNYIFGVSFKLADNEYCLDKATNTSVILSEPEGESWTLTPDENGVYYKDGLKYNTQYQINVSVDTDKGTTRSITENIQTQEGSVSAGYKATQTTITIMGVYKKTDSTCKDIVCGVEFNGQEYVYDGKDIVISGLRPNYTHYIYPFAYYGEHRIIGNNYQYKTKSLSPKASGIQGPTTNIITGSYVNGDAHVSETGFTGTLLGKDGVKGDRLNLSGLEPGKEYTVSYYVKTEEGSNETTNYTFTTPALELTTLQPKSVSNTCAIIAAETNIADEETNVGFQWKKYDAPSTLKPSEGYAAIYSGMMEGRVKNLQPTSYYNVRAFYKSAAGNYHYGEWVTFDPSDFSYFEPTVHTYPVEEASDGSYNVKGYALAGTDDITEQGFQYGEVGASESKAMRVRAAMSENGLITVLAKGQVMTATLKDLKPSTTYVCRAFVVTAGGTTYGEEQIFTTKGNTTGIDTAVTGQKKPEITGYYDLSGHRIDAPCKGVSIIRYSDGSARKVVVK